MTIDDWVAVLDQLNRKDFGSVSRKDIGPVVWHGTNEALEGVTKVRSRIRELEAELTAARNNERQLVLAADGFRAMMAACTLDEAKVEGFYEDAEDTIRVRTPTTNTRGPTYLVVEIPLPQHVAIEVKRIWTDRDAIRKRAM